MDQCSVCRNTKMDQEHADMCVTCADKVRAHEMCRMCGNQYDEENGRPRDAEKDICFGCAGPIRAHESQR